MIEGLDVSRETMDRLETYQQILEKWNISINLVAKGTINEAWRRHFVDSAQIYRLAALKESWVDLGSGGGFPGLVCATIASEASPSTKFTLVESDKRKATFLRQVINALDLDVIVLTERIENLQENQYDTISARALAPLSKLLEMSNPLLKEGGQCAFLKGARFRSEVEEALESWRFSLQTEPSKTDQDAAILIVKDIQHVGP